VENGMFFAKARVSESYSGRWNQPHHLDRIRPIETGQDRWNNFSRTIYYGKVRYIVITTSPRGRGHDLQSSRDKRSKWLANPVYRKPQSCWYAKWFL